MAGNAQPQFTRNGNVSSIAVTAGNASSEGDGTIATDTFKAFTADGTNGSFVESVVWIPTATSSTLTTATVGRIYISSVSSGSTTSANTWLINEIALPAVTAAHATNPIYAIEIPIQRRLPAGYTILVQNQTAPAGSTQWIATVFGGDY